MESALSNHSSLSLSHRSPSFAGNRIPGIASFVPYRRPSSSPAPAIVVARSGSSSSSSHCEPSSGRWTSNIPIEPRSSTGKFISDVFQNQKQLFHTAVREELKLLAAETDAALARSFHASASAEAVLHRKIAELKERDCRIAAEDVIHILILQKFSEIRVPLLPKLSKCIHNGRLEQFPAKDYELESIHTPDSLEMIKEHVSTMIGLQSDSSVSDSSATTEITLAEFRQVYASSILYGYFLKSASARHGLDLCLGAAREEEEHHLTRHSRIRRFIPVLDRVDVLQSVHSGPSLRAYVMGFEAETLQRMGRLRSEEGSSLVQRQSRMLFGDGEDGEEESVVASFSSLRRLVLEAAAFGTFLWDSEEYVDSLFKLKGNGR